MTKIRQMYLLNMICPVNNLQSGKKRLPQTVTSALSLHSHRCTDGVVIPAKVTNIAYLCIFVFPSFC